MRRRLDFADFDRNIGSKLSYFELSASSQAGFAERRVNEARNIAMMRAVFRQGE
jgi:hypothetical protein